MTGPLAGEPRERKHDVPVGRRVRSWLVWWVLLMSFWVISDDSIATDAASPAAPRLRTRRRADQAHSAVPEPGSE